MTLVLRVLNVKVGGSTRIHTALLMILYLIMMQLQVLLAARDGKLSWFT